MNMAYELDVIVALGGPTVDESNMRADKLANLYLLRVAPHMLVTGASWAFSTGEEPTETMGQTMHDYVVGHSHLPADNVTVLDRSLDTIGDALSIKHEMRARGVHRLGYVTTASHVERAGGIIEHVLGPDYEVRPYSAGNFPGRRGQRVYERIGGMLASAVLDKTEPGDDEAIMERLFALVPGYTGAGKVDIAKNHLRRLVGLEFVQFEPVRQLA